MSIIHGDCLEVLAGMEPESIDSCVTDPPYHFTSIVRRFGAEDAAPAKSNGATGVYERSSRGFMGKTWDGGDVAFQPETWQQVLRVLRPGAHLVAFGAPKNYHRLACAIEDAGFEVRDCLMWLFGTGFPKSLDVSKAIDKAAGAVRELTRPGVVEREGYAGTEMRGGTARAWDSGSSQDRPRRDHPATDAAREWEGWGTALKPAYEPIILARKPLSGTVAENVLQHGTGALNIDRCRVATSSKDQEYIAARIGGFNNTRSIGGDGILGGGQTMDRAAAYDPAKGRWPANIVHDGSEEVLTGFPESAGQQGDVRGTEAPRRNAIYGEDHAARRPAAVRGDSGSAARFFYCAKASAKDRAGSKHPTVKPIALMRWLVRLITPPGGLVLDPFAGSGTTLQAAREEGFRAIGIEQEAEYIADIERRLSAPLAPQQLGLEAVL